MPVVEFDKVPHENSREKINELISRTEDTVFKKNLEQALDIVEECFNRLVISSDPPFKEGKARLTRSVGICALTRKKIDRIENDDIFLIVVQIFKEFQVIFKVSFFMGNSVQKGIHNKMEKSYVK